MSSATASSLSLFASSASPPAERRGTTLSESWRQLGSRHVVRATYVSTFVHALAIIVLGLWQLDDARDVVGMAILPTIDWLPPEPPEPEPMSLVIATEPTTHHQHGSLQAASAAPGVAFDPAGSTGEILVDVRQQGHVFGQGKFGFDDEGDGLTQDFGETDSSATFFGISAQGRKFCFVVDCSGSMIQDGRFQRAVTELERSLKELNQHQQYFIAFFNDFAFPMPERKLVKAKTDALRKTTDWIHRAVPVGMTNPWPALSLALRQKPDAIFLLTDGEFDPEVVQRIARLQTGGATPIHTIAFSSQVGEPLLTAIARITKATYRFVP